MPVYLVLDPDHLSVDADWANELQASGGAVTTYNNNDSFEGVYHYYDPFDWNSQRLPRLICGLDRPPVGEGASNIKDKTTCKECLEMIHS